MRVAAELPREAGRGSMEAWRAIVRAYGPSLHAMALASTGSREEAEDAVQDMYLKACRGLPRLREPERFEAWLWAVARSVLATRRRKSRSTLPAAEGLDPELVPDRRRRDEGAVGTAGIAAGLLSLLSPEQGLAIALRHGAGLSLRDMSLAAGLPRSVMKSRLAEARSRLRTLAGGGRLRPATWRGMRPRGGFEERIMDRIGERKRGAALLERLALYDQVRLAGLCAGGAGFDGELLAALGRLEEGTEFIRGSGGRLSLAEYRELLELADAATRARLVRELRRADPRTAEELERGMIDFEDFARLGREEGRAILEGLGLETLARALKGASDELRDHATGLLDESVARSLGKLMADLGAVPLHEVEEAQAAAVRAMRRLAEGGRFSIRNGDSAP